ncbi:MAG: ABC transporter substrate-binding protein [Lachnotalea sp.]
MKKKIISMLLALTMVSSLLSGCSKSTNETDTTKDASTDQTATTDATTDTTTDSGEKVTLSLCWWGNQTRNDLTQNAVNLYMTLNPNVEIKAEFTDWSGYWDKLATMASGGNLPDIIQQDYAYLNQYQESSQLADLTPFIEDGTIDTANIPESVIESGSIDGTCYAMSLGSNAPMMVYDKEIVERAGVEIPSQPTIDEFYDIGKAIYEKTGVKTYFDGGVNMMQILARTTGSHLYDEIVAGTTTTATTHFNNVQRFSEAEFSISPELLVEKNPDVVETKPIIDQTTWNDFSFSNQFISISNAAERDLGICMYPTTADATVQPEFLKPSMFFSIAETSENKQEAAKFLNWFVNSEDANKILMAERGIPANTVVAEAIKGDVDTVAAKVFSYIAEVSKIAEPIDAPNPSGSGEVEALLKTTVEYVRYGDLNGETASEEFIPAAQSILAEAAK